VVLPSGLTSGRAYFNLDWITLLVMAVVTVAGIVVYFAAHGGREIGAHMVDTDAPGYLPPPAPGRAAEEAGAEGSAPAEGTATLEDAGTVADAPGGGSRRPEAG
jgi:hypothetical protein